MKDKTKTTLKLLLTSNIKNDDAMVAAKTAPWWIALILGLVSVFLPVIPLMVNVNKTYGSSIFASQKYGLDSANTGALLDLKERGYDFKVDGNKQLLMYEGGSVKSQSEIIDNEPIAEYISTSAYDIKNIEYQIYYTERSGKKLTALIKELDAVRYIDGGTTKYDPEANSNGLYLDGSEASEVETSESEGETIPDTYYRPSFLLLFKGGLYFQIYTRHGVKRVTSMSGDWYHTTQNEYIIENLLKSKAYPTISFTKDTNGAYTALRDADYVASVHKNFSKMLDNSFVESKIRSFWSYTGIFLGIYMALIVFMGLLCFLLTRGKNNPMNYLSFWTCVKLVAWCALAPALLAMILGFVLSQYATMYFIVLMGMRIMWLSMRQLRPAQ